ncbi:hypothetical protein LX36DRAFT_464371 [Colletotrichum falcatum]|nr:hypothetical protein LX36DRAFT_464371 [Colletotrichum falcatum]
MFSVSFGMPIKTENPMLLQEMKKKRRRRKEKEEENRKIRKITRGIRIEKPAKAFASAVSPSFVYVCVFVSRKGVWMSLEAPMRIPLTFPPTPTFVSPPLYIPILLRRKEEEKHFPRPPV